MEESGELVRACSKILRHGTTDLKYISNLIEEIGDVQACMQFLIEEFTLDTTKIDAQVKSRKEKMLLIENMA